MLRAVFGVTCFLALTGLGHVVQRYVLRQRNPDSNMAGVGMATLMLVFVLAVFVLTKIYGF
jgi:hypothetical protein